MNQIIIICSIIFFGLRNLVLHFFEFCQQILQNKAKCILWMFLNIAALQEPVVLGNVIVDVLSVDVYTIRLVALTYISYKFLHTKPIVPL